MEIEIGRETHTAQPERPDVETRRRAAARLLKIYEFVFALASVVLWFDGKPLAAIVFSIAFALFRFWRWEIEAWMDEGARHDA